MLKNMCKNLPASPINWGIAAALSVALGFAFQNWAVGIGVGVVLAIAMAQAGGKDPQAEE
jgi:hypothetical protein